jgi:diguanylate cyclase (GGDEF)-like protein
VAIIAGLIFRIARLRQRLKTTDSTTTELRASLVQMRRGQFEEQFLSDFLREFPLFTRELHAPLQARHIPAILLKVLIRCFQPEQAVVMVRRRGTASDPGRGERLVVAAVSPPESGPRLGTEVSIGEGEVGFVADVQRVMDRRDFAEETAINLQRIRHTVLPGFKPDLAAPMLIEDETVGVLALAGSPRQLLYGKDVMRIIAQIGAFAIHHAERFSEVRVAADIDPLTGICNKRLLNYKLGELLFEAERQGSALSIFLFDLDHFKNYNDINGHQAGDLLLQTLARLVQDSVRREDIFGRFGGEEFLLVLPGTHAANARIVAEKICARVASHEFHNSARQPLGRVSISGGVASYPADGRDSFSLLQAADEALYTAKQLGRNRVIAAQDRFDLVNARKA